MRFSGFSVYDLIAYVTLKRLNQILSPRSFRTWWQNCELGHAVDQISALHTDYMQVTAAAADRQGRHKDTLD